MSRLGRLAEGEERDQKHSPLSSTPEWGMLQGSRFECRSGKPGRTLWCLGAPTRTCCGVTQGVKLRGQRRQPCQPRGGARPGETWKAEVREGSQGSSLRSGQRG